MEQIKNRQTSLFKKFHILCGKAGIEDYEKRELIRSYGAESSKTLSIEDLRSLCDLIQYKLNLKAQEEDKWRKRVIAAICGYIDRNSICTTDKVKYAKNIASKASSVKDFNEIPIHKLQSLYNMFLKSNSLALKVESLLAETEILTNSIKKQLNIK